MDFGLILYVIGWGAFFAAMVRPHIGLYYMVPLLPMQTVRYGMHGLPLGASMIDIVLVGVIIGMWREKEGPLFADLPMKKLLVVYAGYCYLSLWHGSSFIERDWPISVTDPRVSNCKNFLELFLLYAVAFKVLKDDRRIKVVLGLMFTAALIIGFLFYQDMSRHDFSTFSYDFRESGVMGYAGPNGMAAFEVQLTLFLVGCGLSVLPRGLKRLYPFVLLACIYSVLFSFSRSAYLALVVGVLFLVVVRKRALLIPALAVVLGAGALFPAAIMQRITGTFVQSQNTTDSKLEASAQERVIIWEDAISVIRAHPVFGTGFDTYQFMHRVAQYSDTHNYYLKALFEQGIVGLCFLVTIMGRMFSQGYKLYRQSPDPFYKCLGMGFAACMVGAIVVNFFGDRWTYLQVDSYWWVLLALICRAQMLGAEPEETGPQPADLVLETAGA